MCSENRSSQKILLDSSIDQFTKADSQNTFKSSVTTNFNGCSDFLSNTKGIDECGKLSTAQLANLNLELVENPKFSSQSNLPISLAVLGELQKFPSSFDNEIGNSAVSIQRIINPHFLEASEEKCLINSNGETEKPTTYISGNNQSMSANRLQNAAKHVYKNTFHLHQNQKHHLHRSKKTYMKMLPTTVEKRNARERTRVHTVNEAFQVLKKYLPQLKANTKRVSKLKILKASVNYIYSLIGLLEKSSSPTQTASSQRKSSSRIFSKSSNRAELLTNPVRSESVLMPDINLLSSEENCLSQQPLATTFPFPEINTLSQYSSPTLLNFPIYSTGFNSLSNYCENDPLALTPVYNSSIFSIGNGSGSSNTVYTSLDSLYSGTGQLSSMNQTLKTIVNLF